MNNVLYTIRDKQVHDRLTSGRVLQKKFLFSIPTGSKRPSLANSLFPIFLGESGGGVCVCVCIRTLTTTTTIYYVYTILSTDLILSFYFNLVCSTSPVHKSNRPPSPRSKTNTRRSRDLKTTARNVDNNNM